jgi:hypothetical protein
MRNALCRIPNAVCATPKAEYREQHAQHEILGSKFLIYSTAPA